MSDYDDMVESGVMLAAAEGYGECSHPSLDGVWRDDLWVCMACSRLVRISETKDGNLTFTTMTVLSQDDIKAFLGSVQKQMDILAKHYVECPTINPPEES